MPFLPLPDSHAKWCTDGLMLEQHARQVALPGRVAGEWRCGATPLAPETGKLHTIRMRYAMHKYAVRRPSIDNCHCARSKHTIAQFTITANRVRQLRRTNAGTMDTPQDPQKENTPTHTQGQARTCMHTSIHPSIHPHTDEREIEKKEPPERMDGRLSGLPFVQYPRTRRTVIIPLR